MPISPAIEQHLTVVAGFVPKLDNPQEGQVMVFDSTTSSWVNKTLLAQGEEEVLAKRTDFIGSNTIYKGEAAVGSLDSLAAWRIRRILIAVDGDISETFASGTANFDKIWDDRLTYTYS